MPQLANEKVRKSKTLTTLTRLQSQIKGFRAKCLNLKKKISDCNQCLRLADTVETREKQAKEITF